MQREERIIGECRLDVRRYGAGSPLVVLHGEYGVTFTEEFLERLGAHHEVFVPHHPAWAGSTRPTHIATTRDIALVQQEFIEGFGAPVPVIGLSFGGWVAAEVAVNVPSTNTAAWFSSLQSGSRSVDVRIVTSSTSTSPRRTSAVPCSRAPTGPPMNPEIALEIATGRRGRGPLLLVPLHARPRTPPSAAPHYRARPWSCRGRTTASCSAPTTSRPTRSSSAHGAAHRRIAHAGHSVEEEMPDEVVTLVNDFVAQQVPVTVGR